MLTPQDCGAVGDGQVDDTDAVHEWINSGEGLLGATEGEFRICRSIGVSNPSPITVRASRKVRFLADSAIDNVMFYVWGPQDWSWDGGQFDTSAVSMSSDTAIACGSCFELVQVPTWEFRSTRFYAGQTYADGIGDTAIALTDCGPGVAAFNYFRGFADNDIYVSGGNSPTEEDDGAPIRLIGNHHDYSSCAVAVKRRAHNVIIDAPVIRKSYVGIGAFETGQTEPRPGDTIQINGGQIIDTVRPIEFRGGDGFNDLNGVRIEDWGYFLDGTPSSDAVAVRFLGSRESTITGGYIGMRRRDPTASHTAIQEGMYTFGSTTWVAGDNTFQGITFAGRADAPLRYALYQAGSTASHLTDARFVRTEPTPFLLVRGSHVRAFRDGVERQWVQGDTPKLVRSTSLSGAWSAKGGGPYGKGQYGRGAY